MRTVLRARLISALIILIGASSIAGANAGSVVYTMDFDQPDGPALEWLKEQGFKLRLDAKNIDLKFDDKRLKLETHDERAGVFEKLVDLADAKRVRIHWGVEQYPLGADWNAGINAVPIAVMTSFGKERHSSGAFYIPSAPYFIGLFLGEKEDEDKAYIGRYFKDTGRYFCASCGAPEGETIVTEFDLVQAFEDNFPGVDPLPLTGFAFQMNTKKTEGEASAYLEKIEFLSD